MVEYRKVSSSPVFSFSASNPPELKQSEKIKQAFAGWDTKITAQKTDKKLYILAIEIEGRHVGYSELQYLCDKIGARSTDCLYSGKHSEDLLSLAGPVMVWSEQGTSLRNTL